MFILITKFDIIIYSKALNINLTHIAWFMDIFTPLVTSFALFYLYKSRIPSLIPFIIMLISIFKLYPLFAFSSDYLSVDNNVTTGNYIISNHQSTGVGDGSAYLTIFVYKEKFPLLYTKQGRYSAYIPSSSTTYKNYNSGKYTILKGGKILSYGDFSIPLK